eukprot:507264-Pleurochrysis_carterae.AAC.3
MRTDDGDGWRLAPLLLAPTSGAWREAALDDFFHALMVVVGRYQAGKYPVHSTASIWPAHCTLLGHPRL